MSDSDVYYGHFKYRGLGNVKRNAIIIHCLLTYENNPVIDSLGKHTSDLFWFYIKAYHKGGIREALDALDEGLMELVPKYQKYQIPYKRV